MFKIFKGDGRKVVFILGVDEKSLKLVSNKLGLHMIHIYVIIKSKKSTYFGLTKNDEIHRTFSENKYTDYLNRISKNINLEKSMK